MKSFKQILINVATATLVVVVLYGASSCSKDEVQKIEAVKDRQTMPGLAATKITTVISDSGITRYRIYTDKWDVYDRTPDPYWEFTEGIHFERFDENLEVDANFHSKYARYYQYKKLWEFKDSVKAVNLKGEMFETDLLYWDEKTKKIYSDKFIRVTQETRIITAIGFDSDQSLTKYHFKNVQGIIAVDENESAESETEEVPQPIDTISNEQ